MLDRENNDADKNSDLWAHFASATSWRRQESVREQYFTGEPSDDLHWFNVRVLFCFRSVFSFCFKFYSTFGFTFYSTFYSEFYSQFYSQFDSEDSASSSILSNKTWLIKESFQQSMPSMSLATNCWWWVAGGSQLAYKCWIDFHSVWNSKLLTV